jgi:hypothetical protein
MRTTCSSIAPAYPRPSTTPARWWATPQGAEYLADEDEEFRELVRDTQGPTEDDLMDAATIQDSGRGYGVSVEGKWLGRFDDMDEALDAIADDGYTGDIYVINDHGNVTLVDENGNEFKSWV